MLKKNSMQKLHACLVRIRNGRDDLNYDGRTGRSKNHYELVEKVYEKLFLLMRKYDCI